MNRRAAVGIIGAAVLVGVLLLLAIRGGDDSQPVVEPLETDVVLGELPDDVEGVVVELYFPDEQGMLSAEERELAPWTTPEQGARHLLHALFAGPRDPGLVAPLPAEAALGTVHLSAANVLYVDLVSTELSRPPSTGSQEELLSIWSLVDTVVLGIPEIEALVLTWNSRQLTSFSGHVDTTLPLFADADLIRTRR